MKEFLRFILFFTPMFLESCFPKCGKNTFMGKYDVSESVKEHWVNPVVKEKLTYINDKNDTVVYIKSSSNKRYDYNSLGQNCNGGWGDSSEDYYEGEYTSIIYESNSDISIEIRAIVSAAQANMDSLGYAITFSTYGPGVGATVSFGILASDETQFIWDLFWINQIPDFSAELEINETKYSNVYYGYHPTSQINEPSIYFQKQKGIIAYRDASSNLWYLVD
tara:strand:+ start:264 stop:926 length:663 start_codon:yes stop_codon:yes gene_type:complete